MDGPKTYDSQAERFRLNPERIGEAIVDVYRFIMADHGSARPGIVGENRILRVTANVRADGMLIGANLATIILDSAETVLIMHQNRNLTNDPHDLQELGRKYK